MDRKRWQDWMRPDVFHHPIHANERLLSMRTIGRQSSLALALLLISAITVSAEELKPKYEGGYPTQDTANAAFEEYDYQAACQFYIWGYAYLTSMGYDKGLAAMGGDERSIYIFDKQYQPQHILLTPNSEVIYVCTRAIDLKQGPVVLEVPPRSRGHFFDIGRGPMRIQAT
jgi:hypothetical protein